jgi:hypothetical protein
MPANLNVLGPPLNYEVTLEPSNRPWLFVVDATAQAPRLPGFELRQTPQLQWLTSRPLTDIVRYGASSHPDFRYGPTRASGAAQIALRDDVPLPAGYNPRTIELAAELRRDPALAAAPAPVLVQAVLQRLRTGGYRYTLDPGRQRPAQRRRVLVRPPRGLLRAHRLGLRDPDACAGRACARGHRLPGRRGQQR